MSRVLAIFLFVCPLSHGAETMAIKPDEKVVFYPCIAKRTPGKNSWQLQIRGLVYEPEKRPVATAVLREALDLDDLELTVEEQTVFNHRARLFLADHERGKKAFVRIGDDTFFAGKSRADGVFTGMIAVDQAVASFAAALPPDDARSFVGQVFPLDEAGLSVISDIDDTIKITEVRDRDATLRNTFLREFRPVPGMAEFYRRLERGRGAQFHYVSASPWQLYEPLAAFVRAENFPGGTFAMKEFRWKNRTFMSLFADPEKYKPTVIEPLLKQFPERRFILIGDSGERDPEIYAALARKFPKQIERIYIRDVTGESAESERHQKVFRGLSAGLWRIFSDPAELELPPATPAR